jgi:hypothetical protein
MSKTIYVILLFLACASEAKAQLVEECSVLSRVMSVAYLRVYRSAEKSVELGRSAAFAFWDQYDSAKHCPGVPAYATELIRNGLDQREPIVGSKSGQTVSVGGMALPPECVVQGRLVCEISVGLPSSGGGTGDGLKTCRWNGSSWQLAPCRQGKDCTCK